MLFYFNILYKIPFGELRGEPLVLVYATAFLVLLNQASRVSEDLPKTLHKSSKNASTFY